MADEIVKEEVVVEEKVETIQPAGASPDSHNSFEKHVYDCPVCHKKLRVHFNGTCGCPEAANVYDWTVKHLGGLE